MYSIYSFYRFIKLNKIEQIKKKLELKLKSKQIKGTILISKEGINGSLSGNRTELDESLKNIKKFLNIRLLELKKNNNTYIPFERLKIKLKKEIVSLGQGELNINKKRGIPIKPKEWDKIILNKDFNIIDTRNNFEVDIGSFQNSINPQTNSFREFPLKFEKLKISKKSKIAMFCTGGIRCEKASSYLRNKGFKNVYQLEGGIISYLDYKNKHKITRSAWKGECFVFDNRVTVNQKLQRGKYSQCYGCRSAITKKEIESKFYKKGVYCPKCYYVRTDKQKERSEMRQKQIQLSKK